MTTLHTDRHQVVVIGGGFAGLKAVLALKRAKNVQITLLDRKNYHLFQPLLYQVATGALSPANIAAPLRAIVNRQKNVQALLATVTGIDTRSKQVLLDDGSSLPYDTLIVATGVRHHYFGNDHWEAYAPGLKTIEDATEIRRRVLYAFEAAEKETDSARQTEWLTFVIVGGGPTGVELAGAIAEIARRTLKEDFRRIDTSQARVVLIEGTDRVLPGFAPSLSKIAADALYRLGVDVMLNTLVTEVQPNLVTYRQREATAHISTQTILWSAGVQASSLGKVLAHATGAVLDRTGRVTVQADLTIPGYPDVFVVGDLAHFEAENGAYKAGGQPLPGVAQVAMQQGTYTGRAISRRLRGEALPPFRYLNLGMMATIGRNAAVADIFGIKVGGFLGWLIWLFIHIMYIIVFENRVLILFQWAVNYVTWNRSARLITGRALPGAAKPEAAPEASRETA
jgi:NADH dehydrogenase